MIYDRCTLVVSTFRYDCFCPYYFAFTLCAFFQRPSISLKVSDGVIVERDTARRETPTGIRLGKHAGSSFESVAKIRLSAAYREPREPFSTGVRVVSKHGHR